MQKENVEKFFPHQAAAAEEEAIKFSVGKLG